MFRRCAPRFLAVAAVLMGCGAGAQDRADAPVAGGPADAEEIADAAAPDRERDVSEARADVADAPSDAPNVGVCEQLVAFLTIRTADGRANISAVELDGCRRAPGCWPMAAVGDAGALACAEVVVLSTQRGPCGMLVTSTDGRIFRASAEAVIVPSGRACRSDSGRIVYDLGYLKFEPAVIVVDFDAADAGSPDTLGRDGPGDQRGE
jgi:hypothetical protein